MNAACKIPCTIVTGFLGAGKSSLIGHLVSEQKSCAIAILSHESKPEIRDLDRCVTTPNKEQFAAVQAFGSMASIDDIAQALKRLLAQRTLPERIVIETGGLDVPSCVLELIAHPDFAERIVADGTIAVVDGYALSCSEFGGRRDAFRHRYPAQRPFAANPLADIFLAQLLCADVVFLNKIDLITTRDRADIINRVCDITARRFDILETSGCRPPDGVSCVSLISAAALSAHMGGRRDVPFPSAPARDFSSVTVKLPEFVSDRDLVQLLADLSEDYDVLRMKGLAFTGSSPGPFAIEGVGRRVRVESLIGAVSTEQRSGFLTIVSERKLVAQSIRHALMRNLPDIGAKMSAGASSSLFSPAGTARVPEDFS